MKAKKRPCSVRKVAAKDIESALGVVAPQDAYLCGAEDSEESRESQASRKALERLHREYRIEINWDSYDESQIQLLIAIIFHCIGYHPENLHEADRAREEGADLVLKKRNESIALAVKVKPRAGDRQQLADLSRRDEGRKIYVYIHTPSAKFRDCMGEYDGIVDFWNRERLNEFFVTKNLGFTANLIVDDSHLFQTIRQAQDKLFGLLQKCRRLKRRAPAPLDGRSFRLLFRLKDEGVSLHKSNESVMTLLEEPVNFKRRELSEHFLKLLLKYMDTLNGRLESFLHHFEEFYAQNEDLVNNSVIDNDGRSHWLWLQQCMPDNSVSALGNQLREAIENDRALKKLERTSPNRGLENWWKESAKNNDVWAVIESRVRNLMVFGAGIEAIVDDIVYECARHYERSARS